MDARSKATVNHVAISRLVDAPRELVFRAWTDPEQLARWCVLGALTTTHMESDPRPGGKWSVDMRDANGVAIEVRRVYREIVAPERIVFYELCNAGGNVILDGTHTVTLEDVGGKTRITVTCELKTPFDEKNQQGWTGGWLELFERLGRHLGARAAASAG